MTVAPSTPLLLTEVEAVAVDRISPSFVRVELAGPALVDLEDGPRFDQRIKLLFPVPGRPLPSIAPGEDWFERWQALPAEDRGHLRSYTIRAVRGHGADLRVVVDLVVHEDGLAGPGASWALAARPGDRLLLVAPRRGVPFGGIEFAPPAGTRSLLLVGDETALPAVSAILEDLPGTARGTVFVEVPEPADIADLHAPLGIGLCWLPRRDAAPGARLVPAVREHLGLGGDASVEEGAVDPGLWETPTYSSSGADLDSTIAPGSAEAGLYAWIAGESGMVTALRRALVVELGVPRARVAFMGYWRRGVVMRS
jgi:NADPH-dependent ferric siderophore reductase